MPWDVLVNRLDRYLRLGYASAVLAGFVLAAEVTVFALEGSPEHRRAEIADAATSVSKWDVSTLVLLVVVAAALVAAYLVGITGRALTFAIVFALVNAINLLWREVLHWWRVDFALRGPNEPESALRGGRLLWNRMRRDLSAHRRRRPRPARPGRPRRRLSTMLRILGGSVARSLLQPFVPYVMRPKDVWTDLNWTYGADTVNTMLGRHPLRARVDVSDLRSDDRLERERARDAIESQVQSANEYCQLWLQRYAAEVAIPPRATRSLILGTAALPAILLPPSLRRVGDDLGWILSLLGPLQLLLLLGAVVLFIGLMRELAGQAAATFRRFVVVELAEQARRDPPGTGVAAAEQADES